MFAFDVIAAILEVQQKEICYSISSIVGSSRRGRLKLSADSRQIDCKPRIFTLKYSQSG